MLTLLQFKLKWNDNQASRPAGTKYNHINKHIIYTHKYAPGHTAVCLFGHSCWEWRQSPRSEWHNTQAAVTIFPRSPFVVPIHFVLVISGGLGDHQRVWKTLASGWLRRVSGLWQDGMWPHIAEDERRLLCCSLSHLFLECICSSEARSGK